MKQKIEFKASVNKVAGHDITNGNRAAPRANDRNSACLFKQISTRERERERERGRERERIFSKSGSPGLTFHFCVLEATNR